MNQEDASKIEAIIKAVSACDKPYHFHEDYPHDAAEALSEALRILHAEVTRLEASKKRVKELEELLDLETLARKINLRDLDKLELLLEESEQAVWEAHQRLHSTGAVYYDGCSIADGETGESVLTVEACHICRRVHERSSA